MSSPDQANSIFEASQLLSACLAAFRRRESSPDYITQELASLWDAYRNGIKELWNAHNLPLQPWGKPKDKPAPWLAWAGALARRDHAGSIEQTTVRAVHEIVKQAGVTLAVVKAH